MLPEVRGGSHSLSLGAEQTSLELTPPFFTPQPLSP